MRRWIVGCLLSCGVLQAPVPADASPLFSAVVDWSEIPDGASFTLEVIEGH